MGVVTASGGERVSHACVVQAEEHEARRPCVM